MKILHITNGDTKGGSERCLLELMNYETSHEISPVLLTPKENELNTYCDKNNIENYHIPYYWFMYPVKSKKDRIKYSIRRGQYYIENELATDNICKVLDIKGISLIHTNNSVIDFGVRISEKYNIPHVWHLREGGIDSYFLKPFVRNLPLYMMKENTQFIATSNAVKSEWVKLGIRDHLIKQLYDGVKAPVQELSASNSDTNLIKFVVVGEISETKGQNRIVEALERAPKTLLRRISIDFWGHMASPTYEEKIKKLIINSGLDKVITIRGVTPSIWSVLDKYDAGINYTNFEAFGRSTVECLYRGLPVLACNTGANNEIINHLMNGYLFDYYHYEDMINGIAYICDNIEEFRLRRKIIKDIAIERFSADLSSKKIVDYFMKVAKSAY